MNEAESREDLLVRLTREPGFYVPKFYEVHYHEDGSLGQIEPTNGAPRRVFTMRNPMRKQEGNGKFDDAFIPASEILTDNTEMSGRYLMEISRGCSMGCASAGQVIPTLRRASFQPKNFWLARLRCVRTRTKSGLSPLPFAITRRFTNFSTDWKNSIIKSRFRLCVWIRSRLSCSTRLFAATISNLRLRPKQARIRLRRVINKNLTNDEVVQIAEMIFERGIFNLKLYMMIGLPTEEDEDIDAIVELTDRIRDRMIEIARPRGRVGSIIVSLNAFVPKPQTPFQWEPIQPERELDRKIKYLTRAFKIMPNVEMRAMSSRIATLQATDLARRPQAFEIHSRSRSHRQLATGNARMD